MTDIINYTEIMQQTHILIGGTTGSGKSVLINGFISNLLNYSTEMILIDLKKVELIAYKHLNNTICYADTAKTAVSALKGAIKIIESRYNIMQLKGIKKCTEKHVYVIIDELADLMTVCKRDVLPLLQRIGQIGRAANVHLVCATQCPLVSVIPTSLKVNFTCIIGLKTRSKQDSRNILGCEGCETLPMYGYGYVLIPGRDIELYSIPYIKESAIKAKIKPFQKNFIERHIALCVIVCLLIEILILH